MSDTKCWRLYLIQFDGEPYYVEAADIADAVAIWRDAMRISWAEDFDGTEQPESATMIHEEHGLPAVLRRGSA